MHFMKNIRNYTVAIFLLGVISACNNDFLERYPTDEISPQTVFISENDLETYTNSYYTLFEGGSAIYGETADNIIKSSLGREVLGTRLVPTTDSKWGWSKLRDINFFLNNENAKTFDDVAIRNHYLGLSRFFRALFYFQKVRYYGDVPWYNTAIESDDEDLLYKARDPRTLVMDSVLADLDFAITNLREETSIERVTKWTALAIKSRICLYEGTFRKYHPEFELPNADQFLKEAVAASEALMNDGPYSIYTGTGGPNGKPYLDLFGYLDIDPVAEEVILARRYDADLGIKHDVQFYITSRTQGKPGLNKSLVDSYLMADGSRFTDIEGYETMEFYDEVQNRDPRLAQTIVTPGYKRIGTTSLVSPNFESTTTGYQPIKYLNEPSMDMSGQSSQDLPLIRYAEVLLNYAEAKAELGTLTQPDLDASINLLRDRVNMPHLDLAAANANPDPYLVAMYPNVSNANQGVILEIRRERRIELVMELDFRWDDLMRWKEGQLLTRPFRGIYLPGVGEYDLDKDENPDVIIYSGEKPSSTGVYLIPVSDLSGDGQGYILPHKGITKVFDEDKDYLWPLPIEDLTLNPNLTQNPGWGE
jgi:hypothetical protein